MTQQLIDGHTDAVMEMIHLTADLVAAYVSNNTVRASELPEVIAAVHASLTGLAAAKPAEEPIAELKPAVPVKKSVTDEFIISLEDGRRFKSMKRYLAGLGMTPDDYRQKWGLPRDYPMVAPGYAAKRSQLAKESGLGSSRRQAPDAGSAPQAPAPAPVEAASTPGAEAPAKRRGRAKQAA